MDLNQILNQYLELFNNYFALCESLDGVQIQVPKTSTYEKSIVATNYTNIDQYINSIVIPIYRNEATSVIFNSMRNVFASAKSLIELNKPYLDPTIISPLLVNNLLKSFGFDFLDLPVISKRRILTSLVKAYKIKGSIGSILEITKSIANNYNIKELWIQKYGNEVYLPYEGDGDGSLPLPGIDNPEIVFEWTSDPIQVPGGESKVETKLAYDYVVDKHWWLSESQVLDIPFTRAMSPYFVIHKTLNTININKGIALFKRIMYDDLQALQIGGTTYSDRKILTTESLPDSFTTLELWYMIRYFWIYLNFYNIVDDVGRNYFHIDPFITKEDLEREYDENFQTRYSQDGGTLFSSNNKSGFHFTYIHALISELNESEVYRYTQERYNYTIANYQNKFAIVFGKDSNGSPINNITIFTAGKPGEEVTLTTDFWLDDPIVFLYNNYIVFHGGKDINGKQNENIIILDVDTGNTYISNSKFPSIIYGNIVYSVYNLYANRYYIVTENNNTIRLYEQYTAESYPYLKKEINNAQFAFMAFNSSSNIVIGYHDTNTLDLKLQFLTSRTDSELLIDIQNDYPQFSDYFTNATNIITVPYGSGFVFLILDYTNETIHQIFASPDVHEALYLIDTDTNQHYRIVSRNKNLVLESVPDLAASKEFIKFTDGSNYYKLQVTNGVLVVSSTNDVGDIFEYYNLIDYEDDTVYKLVISNGTTTLLDTGAPKADLEDVSTTILTEYDRYPNSLNNAYRLDTNFYRNIDCLSLLSTPHTTIVFDKNKADILYHFLQLKAERPGQSLETYDYDCDLDVNRCFRDFMLTLRDERLILNDSVFPKFNTVQELRDYIYNLVPNNINEFEKSPYKELILFELLVTASQITGTDLTNLMTSYVADVLKQLTNRFKPIYSRMVDLTSQIVLADSVGDWVALADGLTERWTSKQFDDPLLLFDNYLLNFKKINIEELKVSDKFIVTILQTYIQNSFLGDMIGDLNSTSYLYGQLENITIGSIVIPQQHTSSVLDLNAEGIVV